MEVNPVSLKRKSVSCDSEEEYEPTSGPSLLQDTKLDEGDHSNTSQTHQQEDHGSVSEGNVATDGNLGGSERADEETDLNEPNTELKDSNQEAESFIPEELANHDDGADKSELKSQAQESNDDTYEPDLPTSGAENSENEPVKDFEKSDTDTYKPEAQVNDEEDDYDPEADQKPVALPPSLPSRPPTGLPPKPTQTAKSSPSTAPISAQGELAEALRNAYNAYMHSEFANDREFQQLPQEEQVDKIQSLLNEQGIDLGEINYNQVYSYNKPHKHLKDPIPLVPVSEFCRRPNITLPSSSEEEKEYEEFIERENYYMTLQNWDEFPDKSRLFVGNLPANTISKQDLYRIFSQYGEVIQIAIKAGYGFVQFRTAEACLACVQGETDVPLHNKVLRLDASKPQKSRRPGNPEANNPNLSSRGRERSAEDEPAPKRRRGNIDCIVYITGKSSVYFIRQVKKAFAKCQVSIDTEDVTQKNITEVLSEAAYSGFLGACVVKEHKVDVQTYEEQPDGGIKFDEYADIDPDEAAEVMSKAKLTKYGGNPPPYYPQESNYHDNPQGRGNRQRDRDRNSGNFGRNNRRGRGRHGYQGNMNHESYGRHKNNNYAQQPWSNPSSFPQLPPQQQQPYGQVPQTQFSSFNQGQPPQGQFPSPYGSQQPAYNQFPSPQQPAMNLNQPNLTQALQSLDANQVQSMIDLLQRQQSPQMGAQPQSYPMQNRYPAVSAPAPVTAPTPPQAPAAYGQPPPLNYGDGGRRREPNYRGARNRPYGNVPQPHQNPPPRFNSGNPNSGPSALLSQLQSGNFNQSGNPQQSDPNSALMDTLQRLARR